MGPRSLAPWLVLALALTGCNNVGPDYRDPIVARSLERWGREPASAASRTTSGEVDALWWRRFHDRELTSLIDRYTAQNLDLKSAAERVIQGTRQQQVAASQGIPHVDGQSNTDYVRASPNSILSLVTPASPNTPLQFGFFNDGLNASWELDLFGRVSRAVEAADADTLASVENRHGIALAGIAQLAQSYLQLRGTQERRGIAERSLRTAEDNVALVTNRVGNGIANTLDLAQAKAQQSTIAASLPPLVVQEAQLINAIGLLLGEPPRSLEGELKVPKSLPRVPRIVPIGLPRLHAATAQTGVAVANFYPDVTLTGNFTNQSLNLRTLFLPASEAFVVGPTITIPIFEGGRLRGQLGLRESQQREVAIQFQRTVLQAWQEVDDALTAAAQAQRRRSDLARAVAQNRIALDAARQRFTQGLIDFLNVNSNQTLLLQSENALADVDTQIATDLVRLYRALGGGWEISEPPAIVPPPPTPAERSALVIPSPLCGGPCPEGSNP